MDIAQCSGQVGPPGTRGEVGCPSDIHVVE